MTDSYNINYIDQCCPDKDHADLEEPLHRFLLGEHLGPSCVLLLDYIQHQGSGTYTEDELGLVLGRSPANARKTINRLVRFDAAHFTGTTLYVNRWYRVPYALRQKLSWLVPSEVS